MTERTVRRGRTRQQAALDRVAEELFRTRGYTDTHIANLAHEAGVSVSTFYAHFGSKEQAYREVMGAEPPAQDDGEAGKALSARARRTRAALVAAARTCFERKSYHLVRVSDIAEQAGTAVGSFYTYFSSKQDVFTAVMREMIADLPQVPDPPADRPRVSPQARRERAAGRIRQAIEHYFDGHKQFATLTMRADEAMSVHPELMPLRLAAHQASAERITRSLRRWQEAGIVDPRLDPDHAGDALAAMVGHATRVWLTYGQEHDRSTAIDTLTRLWINGIGLTVDGPAAERS
ncbi:TetR/AcrR family transcriptional regulator [Pseudonocardia alaniniphila]|uniref:TetR/AcrR family transcriptional regulator n=1 Tax=Pseudonocardia alaniniphila TaxID=75291 RepID=A0ABS9TEJ7_9PSEU|nr:TetR/AcrR family transcriptional regulator [Pseudonocardia alaniniphila]MCH6166960.1 TetR/AcrR family transcriptional regulator [Pseudonocardia alaniniphila]